MAEPSLRRRDFLAHTASLAGLDELSSLPAGTLLAEAAAAAQRGALTARLRAAARGALDETLSGLR